MELSLEFLPEVFTISPLLLLPPSSSEVLLRFVALRGILHNDNIRFFSMERGNGEMEPGGLQQSCTYLFSLVKHKKISFDFWGRVYVKYFL